MAELYITEKPDVGRWLADYLSRRNGRTIKREKGYISIPGVADVTWGMGHLIELADLDYYLKELVTPDNLTGDGGVHWSASHLPFFPEKYEHIVSSDAARREQLQIIKGLIDKADIIYHAADRDREGQAIVDNILEHFGVTAKDVRRLTFSALDDRSFEDAFERVESNSLSKFKLMTDAATARAIADMVIGLNLTRLLTTLHSEEGVMPAGRVQTPLLGVIVERQWAIDRFEPVKTYTPVVTLPDGTQVAWEARAGASGEGFDAHGRIIDPAIAQAIVDNINAGLAGEVVEYSCNELIAPPPLPFSLPALQIEMSRRHGLSVEETTRACQSLYEKKMQSYIGTDCRFLPESMHAVAGEIMAKLRAGGKVKGVDSANQDLRYACWDDSKVAAHHAIIPTGEKGFLANDAEKLVYQAVTDRYLAQFQPESRMLETKLVVSFGDDTFAQAEQAQITRGWRAVDTESMPEEVQEVSDKNEFGYGDK